MHFTAGFFRIFAACLVVLTGRLTAQQASKPNPADVYLQAYLIMEDGMKLLSGSDYSGAYYKFKDARDMFDSVFHSNPTWNVEIVEYRRKKVRELLETARLAEIERRQKVAAAKGTMNPVPPDPNSAKPKPPSIAAVEAPASPRPTDAVVESKNLDLQERIRQLEVRNEQHLKEIGQKDEQLRQTGEKLVEAQREQRALLEKLKTTEAKLDSAKSAARRESGELEKQFILLAKERDELKTSLEKANQLLAAANENNGKLLADVKNAYESIKTLTKERDALAAEREQLAALVNGQGGADKGRQLAAENLKLKKSLEDLQQRLTSLQKEREQEQKTLTTEREQMAKQREADQKLIAELRTQLDASRAELAQIRDQNRDYQEQMAALSARLEMTEKALAESGGGAIPETDAVRENSLLHEIILKMLKQQAGREKAKEQAVALLEANGKLTDDLLKNLNEMSAPYQMTPAERALLQAGGAAQELPNAGGIQLSLLGQANPQAPAEGTSDKPPEEGALNTELRAFATAADTCFRNQDFSSAEDNYSKILRAAPQDVSTLCNISVVQLRQNKLPDAERNLLKALAYRFDNDFAHYLLGVVHLRQGKLAEARESIEQGLKIKPDNAEGHLSLGFICLKQSRYSAAEKEFKQAVELDSSCADAHFNLAVLYATTDDGRKLDLAKTHYRQAVAHGAPRDPRMDRLFRE